MNEKLLIKETTVLCKLSTAVSYDEYMTFLVIAVAENTRRARCTTLAYHNTVAIFFLVMHVQQVCGFSWSDRQTCERYSSTVSFLLVSCPSKMGYLLSTSAQLNVPLDKSRTIAGNSQTWGGKKNMFTWLCLMLKQHRETLFVLVNGLKNSTRGLANT